MATDFECQLQSLRSDEVPRPRVYFEEWDEPLISGIGWVSEAIHLAGGEDIFFRPDAKSSRDRAVQPKAVCQANPEIIFVSWCGKPVDLKKIGDRPGWQVIAAVRKKEVYSIESGDILQPGPAILGGVKQMAEIIERWRGRP